MHAPRRFLRRGVEGTRIQSARALEQCAVQRHVASDRTTQRRVAHDQLEPLAHSQAALVAHDVANAEVAHRASFADPRLIDTLQGYLEFGFTHLYLHNVNREHEAFIDAIGEHILPALRTH